MELSTAQACRAIQLTLYPVGQPSITTLTANPSVQLFSNASSSTTSPDSYIYSEPYFPYIIPYGRSQDCDIYEPNCQTASITVGVNLTITTIDIVLPCSSYLSARSASLQPSDGDHPYGAEIYAGTPDYWGISFVHSPECRSYAKAYSRGFYIFPECGINSTVFQNGDLGVFPPKYLLVSTESSLIVKIQVIAAGIAH